MADTQLVVDSDKLDTTEAKLPGVAQKRLIGELAKRRAGRPRKIKTGDYTNPTEPLDKRVGSLRYRSVVLAERLADEIRATMDSTLPKKDKARLARELAWTYGVLFDKAAGGEATNLVKISFPAEVLSALKLGVALQVAPKAVSDHKVLCESNSLPSCETRHEASD